MSEEKRASTTTETTLSEETVRKLQDLIQANIDSVSGLREAAEVVDDPKVALLFRSIAGERSELAAELQNHVMFNQERPRTEGSWLAKLHRLWVDFRGTANTGEPDVVLAEAERADDFLKYAYEAVLKATAGSPINDLLLKHYKTVKTGGDQIRELREFGERQQIE